MRLKVSKFLGCCYADEISELQFFGKNFDAVVEKNNLILSFEFMKGLDKIEVLSTLQALTFFEIQDKFLQNKLLNQIQSTPHATKVRLKIEAHIFVVKHIKITHTGFVIRIL